MRLKVFALHPQVPAGLCDYAATTIWASLARHSRYVRRVTVRLRPGQDYGLACRIELWMGRLGTFVIEHTDSDPRAAVRSAATAARQRARQRVSRWLTWGPVAAG